MIEFALSSLVWLPLMLGLIFVGFSLVTTTQMIQLDRDVGHMYANGVDFTQASNQEIVNQLANGLNFSSSGQGVFVFSTILMVGPNSCAGVSPCPNMGLPVVTQRYTLGNASVFTTAYGNPAGINPSNGAVSNYLTDPGAVAAGFNNILALSPDQMAYLVEAYYSPLGSSAGGILSANPIYEMAVF